MLFELRNPFKVISACLYPMLFELRNPSEKLLTVESRLTSYLSWLLADDGKFAISKRKTLIMRNIQVPNATYVKLQPHIK